jgi:riboflavin kinase/FMN adenylyltransferase
VREALEVGDVRAAARLLGRPYFVKSKVVEGKHLGSKLGFPTANQVVHPQKILPQYGVYATRASFNGEKYMGVTSVGVRPTFENTTQANIETLLLDFDDNIYHEDLTIEFIAHLRGEIKFERAQDLINQIEQDKHEARRILTHEPFPENLSA